MNITILSIDIKTIPTAKGSYRTADVAYKNNSFQGKVEGKKVMSFGATQGAFETLSRAASGDIFEVEVVKNDKGYNDWISMKPAVENTAQAASAAKSIPTKSTYETPEERANKQVYIVRQSSIANAIATLSVGAKSAPKPTDVTDLAQVYSDFVFGKRPAGASGFEDLPDFTDIPELN